MEAGCRAVGRVAPTQISGDGAEDQRVRAQIAGSLSAWVTRDLLKDRRELRQKKHELRQQIRKATDDDEKTELREELDEVLEELSELQDRIASREAGQE